MSERVRKVLHRVWMGGLYLAIPVLFWYGLNRPDTPGESESLGQIFMWSVLGAVIVVVFAVITVYLALPKSSGEVSGNGA